MCIQYEPILINLSYMRRDLRSGSFQQVAIHLKLGLRVRDRVRVLISAFIGVFNMGVMWRGEISGGWEFPGGLFQRGKSPSTWVTRVGSGRDTTD